jgi:hypothetical protein
VIVEMGFAVAIQTVGEAHDALPARRGLSLDTTISFTHHERAIFEVLNRRAHGRSMGVEDARRVFGVDGQQDRDRPRRGDDHVVAADVGALARLQYSRDVDGFSRITTAAEPPSRAARAQSVELVGAVVREVRDVVGRSR